MGNDSPPESVCHIHPYINQQTYDNDWNLQSAHTTGYRIQHIPSHTVLNALPYNLHFVSILFLSPMPHSSPSCSSPSADFSQNRFCSYVSPVFIYSFYLKSISNRRAHFSCGSSTKSFLLSYENLQSTLPG